MKSLLRFAPVLILILLVIGVAYFQIKSGNFKLRNPKPSAVATVIPSETPSPSPTLIPTTTPIVTISPVVTRTPQPVSGPPGSGLSTINVATEKGNFTATVLSLDLSNTKVITDTANDSDCTSNCPVLSLQNFITRNNGYAGVNGTYFCPAEPAYSSCGSNNSYDFPVYNTRLMHWINQGNLSWNGRAMFYVDGGGAHYLQNANSFSGGLTAGLVNYPGLLDSGNVQIDDNQSGLSDKQKSVGTKVGIGVRGVNNIMVVVALNVNMQQFAYVFKSLGATGALNLDTGGSTALYYGGHYVYGPGRNIPNAIVFTSK